MLLRLVSNIHAVPHSLFDMVRAPVVRASLYDLGFVRLDSAQSLDTIDEFIVDRFICIGVSLGYKDCTVTLGLHVLHDLG